jgi:hypothetical protein
MRLAIRDVWCLAAVLLAAGCSAGPSALGPPDLDRRLARFERQRLDAAGTFAAHAPQRSEPRRSDRDRPMRLGPGLNADEPAPAFALVDLAPEADGPDGDAASTGDGSYATRRPPLPGLAQTVKRDVKHMAGDLRGDTKRVYGNPLNLVILGVSYGGALAVQQSGPDDTVEDHFNRHHAFSHDWNDAFAAAGNPGTHFALAGLFYLVGQQAQDEKTFEVGRTLFSALIINGLTVLAGQAATWDRSPNGEWGTFPSGHTSSTFVVASVMHEAYGPLVGVPLYGLGALVGISRLDDREHYLSDVLFGAVLGTVIGHSVASGRDPEIFGWKVVPYADPQGGATGVAFVRTIE